MASYQGQDSKNGLNTVNTENELEGVSPGSSLQSHLRGGTY